MKNILLDWDLVVFFLVFFLCTIITVSEIRFARSCGSRNYNYWKRFVLGGLFQFFIYPPKKINSYEPEKRYFVVLSSAWDKEKILSPYEESNLRPVEIRRSEVRFFMGTQNFSLSHAGDKTKKTSFSISLPSSKLTISLILVTKQLQLFLPFRYSLWIFFQGISVNPETVREPAGKPRVQKVIIQTEVNPEVLSLLNKSKFCILFSMGQSLYAKK